MSRVLSLLTSLGAPLVVIAACSGAASPSPSSTVAGTPTTAASATPAPTGTPAITASPTESPGGLPSSGTWTQLVVEGDVPAAREAHTWTADPATGMAYLFGGRDGATVFDDLWRFDPRSESWTRLAPVGAGPAARFGHNAVWLPGQGLVVFAGQSADRFFNDLWFFDPGSGAWSALPSGDEAPIPRYGSCAVLMSDGRLWISHGFTEDRVRFADTRAYDFAAGMWLDQTPSVGDLPVARCLHACFETDDGRFALFGGQTTGTAALGDLWTLEAFTEADRWAQATGGMLPSPRNLYAFARMPSAFVVFGGGSLASGYLDDTWAFSTFDLQAGALPTSGGPPPGRSGASLVEDADGGRLLLFGGRDGDGAFDDVWALTLS